MELLITMAIAAVVAIITIPVVAWAKRSVAADEEREREQREQRQREKAKAQEEETRRLLIITEVAKQAKLVGDEDAYQDAIRGAYRGELPKLIDDYYYTSVFNQLIIFPISGINYRGNLSSYEGEFKGVLVPEPKNDYDPRAIMVKCEDGKHLGYVPEDLTSSVRRIAGEDFKRYRITGYITEREDYDSRKFYLGYVYLVKQ